MTPPSIILIESRQPDNTAIGTGFVIHHTADYTCILTCAHVVRDMGGPDHVKAATLPAEVLALGADNGLDLAVLRVARLPNRAALSLRTGGRANQAVEIEGYYKYISFRALELIRGRIAGSFRLSDTRQEHFVAAWHITIDDQAKLVGGYSGSPLCDAESGVVIGVMITRDGEQQGRAIAVEALRYVWPELPEGLLTTTPPGQPPAESPLPAKQGLPQAPPHDQADTSVEHIRALIRTYRRRLQILELQQALKGINTEPHVLIEIEDLQAKIAEGESRLGLRQALEVELLAFASATSSGTATESLDWRSYYHQATPQLELWQSTLMPELLAMKQRLKRRKATTLLLDSDTRLSAALAFGYVFRESAGFQLRVNQYGDLWTTESHEAVTAPLTPPQVDPVNDIGADVTIELSSVRQHIHPDVDSWLSDHSGRIARRIRVAVTAEKINGPQAMAIARAIFQLISAERKANPRGTIHLFAAMPKGLAVFVGWHLHTCGPVQFYEKIGTSYQESCLLDDRW